jgi:uncharacterized RDD family membrane protein YckC
VASFSFDSTAHAMPDPASWPALFDGVLWRRVMAYGFDLLCIGVIAGLAIVPFLLLWVLSFGLLGPLLWPAFGLIPLAYHTLLLSGPRSATFGMRCFDLELRGLEGERPGFLQALLQTVLFYLSVGATCSLILLYALVNRRKRTLHDVFSSSIVVRAHLLYPPG